MLLPAINPKFSLDGALGKMLALDLGTYGNETLPNVKSAGVQLESGLESLSVFPGAAISMPSKIQMLDEADKLKEQGKLDEAVAILEQVLREDPNFALAHSALAVIYGRLKRHDDAIRHGLKVVELEPNDTFSYTAMSVTYVRAGKIAEAEEFKARAQMMAGHVH